MKILKIIGGSIREHNDGNCIQIIDTDTGKDLIKDIISAEILINKDSVVTAKLEYYVGELNIEATVGQ